MEQEILFLMEAYNQPYDAIMAMPSSRRHRLVKMKEDITRNSNGGGGTTFTSDPSGGNPFPRTGIGGSNVDVGYSQ